MKYAVLLFTAAIALIALEAWWLQSIIEYFNQVPFSYWLCVLIILGAYLMVPKALQGASLLILFVLQCYIWIL